MLGEFAREPHAAAWTHSRRACPRRVCETTNSGSGCARRPLLADAGLTALVVAVSFALAPSIAVGAACPSVDTSYMGNCGPQFAVPNWTDAGGWTDPAKYSTIQLADVNGDGTDELIGRNDDGLEIFWFDTTLGQWRPQVDAKGVRQALTDFASPPPWEASGPQPGPAAVLLDDPGRRHRRPARRGDPGPLLGRDARLQVHPARGRQQHRRRQLEPDRHRWPVQRRRRLRRPLAVFDDPGHTGATTRALASRMFARSHGAPAAQSLAFYTWSNGAGRPCLARGGASRSRTSPIRNVHNPRATSICSRAATSIPLPISGPWGRRS